MVCRKALRVCLVAGFALVCLTFSVVPLLVNPQVEARATRNSGRINYSGGGNFQTTEPVKADTPETAARDAALSEERFPPVAPAKKTDKQSPKKKKLKFTAP